MSETLATISTTWNGWQIVNPKCYGCVYSNMIYDWRLVCRMANRTMMHGPFGQECVSFTPGNEIDAQSQRLRGNV